MRLFAPLALALGCLAALASPTAAQTWPHALRSQSPRLAFYALEKARPRGAEPLLMEFLRRDGSLATRQRRLYRDIAIAPDLSYDANINGGIPNDRIRIAGLPFRVDPDSRAKSGLLVGATLSSQTGYRLARGKVLSLGTTLSLAHAPRHGITTGAASLQGCLLDHVSEWGWMDYCAGALYSRTGSETGEIFLDARYSRALSGAGADHLLTAGARIAQREHYARPTLSLAATSAVAGLGAWQNSLALSPEIDGENTVTLAARTALRRDLAGALTGLSLAYAHTQGSAFFDTPRQDDIVTLALSREITDRLEISLGYRKRASTIDAYDDAELLIGVDIRNWKLN